MKRFVLFLGCALLAFSLQASNTKAVRKTVEASMQVSGEITIAPDGSVKSYQIDKPEALPPEVKSLIDRNVPAWRFEPVVIDGKPVLARTKMGIQVVAVPDTPNDRFKIMIRDTAFGDPAAEQAIVAKNMDPPAYPMDAVMAGVSGTVYLVARLNPDGTVAQVHTEQVNMTVIAAENAMRRWRERLAKTAMAKAKQWSFTVAPKALVDGEPVSVRVPVDFMLLDSAKVPQVKYGTWKPYVPGPYAPIPWDQTRTVSRGIGAMTPGQLYPLDSPIKLLDAGTGS